MKPFNVEEAKAGKPVVDNSGFPAHIICFNAGTVGSRDNKPYHIVALCGIDKIPRSFNEQGEHMDKLYTLHMQPTRKSYWVNCYSFGRAYPYPTKEEADRAKGDNWVACIEVTWEE